MKKALYLKIFIVSVVGALTLSFISLFMLVRFSDFMVGDYRYGYLLYIARAIETKSEYRPVTKINVDTIQVTENALPSSMTNSESPLSILKLSEIGPLPPDTKEKAKPSVQRKRSRFNIDTPPPKVPRPNLWLVSSEGKIISSNNTNQLPMKWRRFKKPRRVHTMWSNDNLFQPKIFMMKLNTTPTTYLISHNERSFFQGPSLWIQGMHTFITAAFATFIALSICFWYLRRKSGKAREVLARLESGDLKARFNIKRFDEFGNLLLDFNRMADQIERLVKRVNDTEASRSNLLQELGHDLRTPLTSLTTSFETLKFHYENLDDEDRRELINMISADIRYFRELLEKLTVVATIDEPHYKASTERIDLSSLLQVELKNRQATSGEQLKWNFIPADKSSKIIMGDYHLITRLFKNALDNASRYAQKSVDVKLAGHKDQIEVFIMDDGPGLSEDALEAFGRRRERRQIKDREAHDFSLGLGSVIMKTIAEVHEGQVNMSNLKNPSGVRGACLHVTFKRPSLS